MATSGTVSTTTFKTRKVIDLAYRNCEVLPEQITSQHLDTAVDLLYLLLSTLANEGLALWCVQKHILPLYQDTLTVPCPLGTVDTLDTNLRTLQRTSGTYSSSEGTADNAFDGDYDTACTQTTPAGYIRAVYDGVTPITSFGLMPNATGTWNISIQTSKDGGATFTSVYTNATFAAVDGQWQWFDLEGITDVDAIQLKANSTTILNVTEFFIGNTPQEIPLSKINRDDYTNLPNKSFTGRPVQFWYDKQRDLPNIILWPVPNLQFSFSQITTWTQRYVQDVGRLTDSLDLPQGWFMGIVAMLAPQLCRSTKEANKSLLPDLDAQAEKWTKNAWAGQTDSSPINWRPNISRYTR
jgi:hypothetical protein